MANNSNQAQCVLVAGGEGFVGASIARALLTRGIAVVTVDDGLFAPSQVIRTISNNALLTRVEADATSNEQLANALLGRKVIAVINCVGPARPTYYRSYPVETAKILVDSTFALLKCAAAHGATFVQASSSETYGDANSRLSESMPGTVHPLSDRAPYAEAKRLCETLIWQYGKRGLRVRILRLFNVYGRGYGEDDDRVLPNIVRCLETGRQFGIQGDGQQVRSFCHVTDAVDAFLRATLATEPGQICVNIGNPEPISIVNLAKAASEIAGRPLDLKFLPELADEVRYRCPEIGLAKACLGWSPKISLEQGLLDLVGHLRSPLTRKHATN